MISLDSKYNSEVSAGIPLGISASLLREQRTTVPVHVHDGGQYPSPKHPASESLRHLKSWCGKSLI